MLSTVDTAILQAQPGDWRKQLLEAMGGSAAVEPSQVQQLSGSASQPAASPLDASTAGELVSGEASLPGQTAGAPCTPPALRWAHLKAICMLPEKALLHHSQPLRRISDVYRGASLGVP